jgi:6-phospho-beta-glucosidase
MDIVLVGRSETALAAVGRAARVLSSGTHLKIGTALIDENVFDGADVVVVQVRVGGYAAREFAETFPTRFGVPGDQALGPGGMATAWLAWPELERLLRLIHASAPNALLIMLTSPLGILLGCATNLAPAQKVIGLCELPWTTVRKLAALAGVTPNDARFEYFGLNHLGWFHQIEGAGIDILDSFVRAPHDARSFPAPALVRQYGGFPTPYWRLHFDQRAVVQEQRAAAGTRAAFLKNYRQEANAVFTHGTASEIVSVLAKRPAPWYSDALAPLLLAVGGGRALTPFFISSLQRDPIGAEARWGIVEAVHDCIDGQLIRRPRNHAVPDPITRLMEPFARFERLATAAVVTRSYAALVDALRSHPWIRSDIDVSAMATELTRVGGAQLDQQEFPG